MITGRRSLMAGIFLFFALAGLPSSSHASEKEWRLVWSDEFNGKNGSGIDTSKWVFDIGGSGWGNQELQYYTHRLQNVYQENGCLVIKAIKETYKDNWNYTSGRIKTKGLFEPKYGRIEARIKIPSGQGIWPAFWMLGNDFDAVNWPNCGEIDIMENIGIEPDRVKGTIHGPGYSGSQGIGQYRILTKTKVADDFHVFAIEWEPNEIRWYVDDINYQSLAPEYLVEPSSWVFDHPFFIILNVAVGGVWPGYPDETTVFPQQMLVDYVRVFNWM